MNTLLQSIMRFQEGSGDASNPLLLTCVVVFVLAYALLVVASFWKLFAKAGKPGWVVLIPLYNLIVLLEIVGRPWWYLVFLFVPGAQIILAILLTFGLSQSFGRSWVFALALTLLFPIFLPILAFDGSVYVGPLGPNY